MLKLDHHKENYAAWVSMNHLLRVAQTDKDGIAEFDSLTINDLSGDNGTVAFYFGAGDRIEGMYTLSEVTKTNYTFVPSINVELVEEPSKHIAAYTLVDPAPVLKVTSIFPKDSIYLTIQINELFSMNIYDNYYSIITKRYMEGTS